jgi:PAS domain S-box-containing protein
LLALAALVAVTVVDAVVGDRAVLVELLVIGPVVATFGASPRHTAIVATLAVLISIPLGAASDAFGSADHLTGLAAVALVGGLAIGIARLRFARETDAARLSVQYGVARVLAEATSLEDVAPSLLEAIGRPLGWEVGNLWEVRDDAALSWMAGWHTAGVEAGAFEQATREITFGRGVGLPGSVWERGRTVWLTDVIADDNNPRAEAASRVGLRGGMAFPVRGDSGCVVVIEFFSRSPREPEPDTIAFTEALGALIGEFVEAQGATAAVRESEARKAAILASALDGVITIDHRGVVLEFNPAAEAIFGRSAAEAIGGELAELVIPPSLRERHRAALRRLVETGEATLLGRRIELTGMRADGAEFPVELAINRILGSDPPVFTGTVRDITERRRFDEEREELLRLEQLARRDASEARDQLEAILSGVADAITAQAADGRMLFANPAALELMGFESNEELLAASPERLRHRFDILDEHGDVFPVERYPGRRALAGQGQTEAIMRLRMHDTGDELWTNVKATPIHGRDGNVVMAINVTEDITSHIRRERTQRFLSNTTAVIGASLDRDVVLGRVASLAVPEVADSLFVDMAGDDGRLEPVVAVHGRHASVAATRPEVYSVLQTGRPRLYRDAGELGMRSAIVVPMVARERTVGALTLGTDPGGRRFDAHDLELARELAFRCAMAIDNARLFSERAYIARTLQQSLLPVELPEIPGVEAAARFRPTGQGNEVGGDFYDMFETHGRGWTVVMGDVCGKGPDAAAVTALARYTLRAAAMRERLPSRSLELLNEAMLRQRDDRRFCTVAYAYLETAGEGAEVRLASGGHPLPLLLRTDGTVDAIGQTGTLLGVVPDPRFDDRSVALGPGDALVFYTDGVVDGRGGDGRLDERTLAGLLSSAAGGGADAIASLVEEAALEATGGNPRDDIAVLVLRVAG